MDKSLPHEDEFKKGLQTGWIDCLECIKQIMEGHGMFTHQQLLKEIEKRIRWKK